MCALRCNQLGLGCNVIRIESGICTFGLLMSSTDNDSHFDSDIEIFLKGLIISPVWTGYTNDDDVLDGQLSDEALCKVLVNTDEYQSGRNVDDAGQTPGKCLNRCKAQNKKIALLDSGVTCYCTNRLPPSDFVPQSECSYQCRGEPGSQGKCGGSWRWSVHAITI